MDIAAEKREIIKQFNLVNDIELIKAIKSLLERWQHKADTMESFFDDVALKDSIALGLEDCKNGRIRQHEDVMADIKARYNL